MTPTSMALSGIAGVAVVSSAVGIPVALHIQGRTNNISKNSGISQVSIAKCEPPSNHKGNSLNFGDPNNGEICGDFKESDKQLEREKFNIYTTFFQDQGKNKDKEGNNYEANSQWTLECTSPKNSNPGKIFKDSSASEIVRYLGFCGDSYTNQTLFVKKRKEPGPSEVKEKLVLLTCYNNWGKTNPGQIEGNQTLFTEEERDNGREVEFYIKK